MNKEEQILIRRFQDLSMRSYHNNMFTFTGFLSLAEQDLLFSIQNELAMNHFTLYGGYQDNERKMARFGLEEQFGYTVDFPIVCLSIHPLIEKFADHLNHRDFLGAIMNLGIERNTIGDIILDGKSAYLFCVDSIAPYIRDELDVVKHTHVKCEVVKNTASFKAKEPVEKELIVSSERVDAVISKLYNISRNQSLELFRAKRVFINGRVCENNSCFMKQGSRITVRGYGKFDYLGIKNETRKDRIRILVAKYE